MLGFRSPLRGAQKTSGRVGRQRTRAKPPNFPRNPSSFRPPHYSLPRVDRSPDLPRRRPTRHELTGSRRRPTTRLSREPAPVLRRNVQPKRGNATSSSGGCRPTLPWRLRPATPKSTLPSSDHRRKICATLYGLSTRTKIMRRSHHDSWN